MGTKLIIIKLFFFVLASVVVQACSSKDYLQIDGRILDESTKTGIPFRTIVVEGLVDSSKVQVGVNAGHFTTDSSGYFKFRLKKIEGARYYNFSLVGDSAYPFTTNKMLLSFIERKSKYLFMSYTRLADLTIIINRVSKSPAFDTLSLYWESNGVKGRSLYPYKLSNYAKSGKTISSEKELRWIGGEVNSVIKTKVFAGKKTRLKWDLDRNGNRIQYTDTITCRRDLENIVRFSY